MLFKINYYSHILMTHKYSFFIKILMVFLIYFCLNGNKISYCMKATEAVSDTPDFAHIINERNETIKILEEQINVLSTKCKTQSEQLNTLSKNLAEYNTQMALLRQENQHLKDEILRLEVIVREQYVGCKCCIS